MSYSYFNGDVRGSSLLSASRNSKNLESYASECKKSLYNQRMVVDITDNSLEAHVGLVGRGISLVRCTAYAVSEAVEHGLGPKSVKGFEGLKLINVVFIPSTAVSIYKEFRAFINPDPDLSEEDKFDRFLQFLSNSASILDTSGMILEGFISLGSCKGNVCVAADAINNVSAVMGLVSYVVDIKTLYEVNRGLNNLKKADLDEVTKDAFRTRFQFIRFNTMLSISSATLANVATVHLNKGTSIPAAWALLAASGATSLIAKGIDLGADYKLAKDLRKASHVSVPFSHYAACAA